MQIRFLYVMLLLMAFSSCRQDDKSKMFTLLSPNDTKVKFKNVLQESQQFNVLEYGYLYNGGGVAIGDLNNDGLPDLYFTGNMVGSRLYLNQGDFKFEEMAEKAGVFAAGLWNTGTTMADVNADGLLDIYVCRSAAKDPEKRRNLLFINNGDMTFTEKASAYGIDDSGYSTQGTFFDYDKDGDLDLYVLNHSTQEYAGFGQITASLKNKRNTAYSDKLYRNDEGTFTDVSNEAGLISNVLGFGLGVAISDLNNDGWPDIYVSNDYNEQDYLYINKHDGTFTESLENYIGHTSLFSMGSDIADINNDGFTDIMTLDMLPEGNYRQKMVSGPDNYDKYQRLVSSGFYNQTMRNMLQLNNQGESFSEIGQLSGISNTDWSWASLFADFDNDGYKDLFITNGYKRDYTNMDFINYAVQAKLEENKTGKQTAIMELIKEIPSTVEENYTYRNNGDLTFSKKNQAWGLDQPSLSNGAAYADLDNDGDLDLVVNNIEEEAFIYRNNSETLNPQHYLKIKLQGENGNRFGIGAKVTLNVGDKVITQEMMPTRGYQSSVDYTLVFGLGQEPIKSLTVLWPDFKQQTLQNVAPDQTLVLHQREGHKANQLQPNPEATLAVRSKDTLIPFVHRENNFIDFKNEQLLPHKLSTQGPHLAQGDVNNDGLEDLFIGGAKGQIDQLLLQNRNGTFEPSTTTAFDAQENSEAIDALFFDADGDGDRDLYVVYGGHEFITATEALQDRFYRNTGNGNFQEVTASLPPMLTNGSCVAAADYDSDGDLDLFVGGRSVPGRYPTAPRSYLLQNDGKGQFKDVTAAVNENLATVGMVTDALWTDFSSDDQPDLLLVGEFMPIRAYKNTAGRLEEIKGSSGLENSKGWWNTLQQGDFDQDGDLDYIAGNFGLNSQLKVSEEEPVQLYVSDFDANGSLDPILCSYIMGESFPVFSKDDLIGQLPHLKRKYVNYADYAGQKMSDIFTAEELSGATVLDAQTFATSYIENLGNDRFALRPLPAEAQFAPVYGLLVKDFNSDGHFDVLTAGNFYGTRVKYGRYDANKGVLLLGDGKGHFSASQAKTSGFNEDGEVRDLAVVKRADGSELLLFVRNNDVISTYILNTTKKP